MAECSWRCNTLLIKQISGALFLSRSYLHPNKPFGAAMAKAKIEKFSCNEDGKIKEQIFIENKASKEWRHKWGIALDLEKFCLEAAAERGISEEKYRRMIKRYKKPRLPDAPGWDVKPLGYVPRTYSGFVGWRSSRPDCALEIFGPMYISPKSTLLPDGPYYTIFLG